MANTLPISDAIRPMTVAEIRARIAFTRAELRALRRLLRQTRAAVAGPRVAEAAEDRPRSIAEAARFLGVSDKTISRMLKAGRLVAVPGTGRTLITAQSLFGLAAGA
jgi:excisionase family DNA binding protein